MRNVVKTLTLILPVAALLAATSVSAKDMDWTSRINKKYGDRVEDVSENYQDALEAINRSSLNADQKKILASQADANKDMALKNIDNVKNQLIKNSEARAPFKTLIKDNKDNRRAVKKVEKILLD